jgi:hypothetical protein
MAAPMIASVISPRDATSPGNIFPAAAACQGRVVEVAFGSLGTQLSSSVN